jgi:predicted Zn-dependent protease
MTVSRRAFVGGVCALCSGGLLACTPTRPDGQMPQTGLGGQSELAPRNLPGVRAASLDDDDEGIRASLDQMERRLRTSRFLVRDATVNDYLGGIVREISGDYAADIRTYVVRLSDFNATQAPNGMMQVWTGLLLRCTNEAQLVAVLGHEFGHYVRAHSREGLRQQRNTADAMQVLAMVFGAAGVGRLSDATNFILTAASFGYGRDAEREADEIGIRKLVERGLAPGEAARNWENLTVEMQARGIPRDRSVIFSTHPSDAERTQTLRRRAEELPAGETRADAYRRGIAPIREMLFDDQIRTGAHAATIVLAERWLADDARDGLALHAKGEALRLRAGANDEEPALQALSAAIEAPQTPAAAWRSLGFLRRKRGEESEARPLLDEYLRRVPDAPDRELIRRGSMG